jgi:hypothetical protein
MPSTPKKENCFIIRASPKNTDVLDHIPHQVEPLHLTSIGNEMAEKRQLERYLGWNGSIEVGKFYDHRGSDTWYYYVYGSRDAFSRAGGVKNQVASLVCYEETYGDVAVVASGPMTSQWPEEFLADELNATLAYYKTEDRGRIFGQREQSRALRGMGLAAIPGMASITLH